MGNQNGTAGLQTGNVNPSEFEAASKGKGKAIDRTPQDMSMDEDDDSSDEETGAEEEEVSKTQVSTIHLISAAN